MLALLLFSSCELFRVAGAGEPEDKDKEELDPIQGRRIYDPETGTYVLVDVGPTEKMDTIRWKERPEDSYPPITSEAEFVIDEEGGKEEGKDMGTTGPYDSRLLSRYNVAVLLPFLSNRFTDETEEIEIGLTEWTLHFYGGVRLALDDLDAEGISLNVSVIDTEASTGVLNQRMRENEELSEAHLIIGPYRRDNVRLAAEFARKEGNVLVSPYSASSRLSDRNPNYIQVSPSLRTHCVAITRHARARYRTDQIVLVSRDNEVEKQRLDFFQEEHFRLAGSRSVPKFRELIIEEDENLSDTDLLMQVEFPDTAVFILPSWSSEAFVYDFLRKLDLARNNFAHIVVYGMPQWMEYEQIDFDYYAKLNVHVSSNIYLDHLSTDIKFFKRRFYERYGAPPQPEAFIGYDVMHYFGNMLNEHGTRFQYMMEREPREVLHTIFDFERVTLVSASDFDQENLPIEQFENKFVNILRFEDYQFKPATD